MKRISVDIGGTFTDCLLIWDEHRIESKSLTTHQNLSLGFMNALEQGCERLNLEIEHVLSEIESVRYATTLGTNTLIERNGPNIGLITTRGYESVVPLSRGRGYGEGLSSLEQQNIGDAKRPESIVPMKMIEGVTERVDYKGEVLIPLNADEVRKKVRTLVDKGARAFVISLINAPVNPIHEKQIEQIILEEYPAHMLGAIPIILSHQVSSRKGEYVRSTSSILNAYLHGQMYHALSSLEVTLKERGYTKPMLVVHNSGGMAQLNSTNALQTIHSGPTSGIDAANHLSNELDTGKLVCMDIGGTSCDIGLVVGGGISFYDFNPVIDRWLVSIPMTHLKVIGAGGGSIARFDEVFDSIEVGPTSAGSDPGPACYDRGGMLPTVTDADLVLGYLDPEHYAGGRIPLNKRRAEIAIEENISDEMDISIIEAALQIKHKVDTNMANAITQELRIKGYNPQDFALLAYGGNGALHSCGIANKMDVNKIFIPPFSSIFSALGAGITNQMHIHEKSIRINIYDAITREIFKNFDKFNLIVEELKERGKEDLLRQGIEESNIQYRLELDMRYGNQISETSVISMKETIENLEDVFMLIEAFSRNYAERFGEGSQMPEAGIRIDTIRVISYTQSETLHFEREQGNTTIHVEHKSIRPCYFSGVNGALETPIYDVDVLSPGTVIVGPALIESPRTTFLVEPNWTLTMQKQNAAWLVRNKNASLHEIQNKYAMEQI